VSIQTLHDAESLDHQRTIYIQQKHHTGTLRAALTLPQKLAEKAKLRVHDFSSKDNNSTTSRPQRSQHRCPGKRVVDRQHCPRSSPKLPIARPERQVQPMDHSAAAVPVVPTPATPPPLSPSQPPGSKSPPRSTTRQNAGPQCELAAPVSSLERGLWRVAAP
jgi:hypothetical protein